MQKRTAWLQQSGSAVTPDPPTQAFFESKLHPPTRRAAVSRMALVDRLVHSGDVPITSVVAPPGYGKTTLLAEWAHRDDATFAWLSLDQYDNDLQQFVSYTVAALERVEPIDRDAPSIQSTGTPRSRPRRRASQPSMAVNEGTRHAHARPRRVARERRVPRHRRGARTPSAAGSAAHARDTRRSSPSGAALRVRAAGSSRSASTTWRWTTPEARRLLADAGVLLTDDDLEVLIARTEGWPVGLYLAALALKAGGSTDAAGISFRRVTIGSWRSTCGPSSSTHMSDDEVRFLTRTAILDRMSGALCDAVLEANGSGKCSNRSRTRTLLLVALDRKGEWYRYHHLFHDLLLGELLRRDPAVVLATPYPGVRLVRRERPH